MAGAENNTINDDRALEPQLKSGSNKFGVVRLRTGWLQEG